MTVKQKLANQIALWNLLNNPFYQAWSQGTLPTSALQSYAAEYGNFLTLLPVGWQTLDNPETAQEEREHIEMWTQFTQSLQAEVGPAQLPTITKLVERAQILFAEPTTAMGALYAFEFQQPATAASKLAGLKTYYGQLHAHEKYFEAHLHNEPEAEKLLQMIEQLSPTEQKIAVEACTEMGQLLWEALTQIHQNYCA